LFTLSMHEKATLRKFLESWRGKAYTNDEADQGIDVELMIGVNAVIQIAHNVRDGSTWADIQSIMKPMKGMTPLQVRDYVRVKDRPADQQPTRAAATTYTGMDDFPAALEAEDDDLPF
jgi:hypothetical protein